MGKEGEARCCNLIMHHHMGGLIRGLALAAATDWVLYTPNVIISRCTEACMSRFPLNFKEICVLDNLPNFTPFSAIFCVLSTPILGPKRVLLFDRIYASIQGAWHIPGINFQLVKRDSDSFLTLTGVL